MLVQNRFARHYRRLPPSAVDLLAVAEAIFAQDK
jgi:hypothetical protein